jgi:hypothetical protein
MKWMDTLFAWALVVLGSAHYLAAWVPKLSLLRGPWAEGAAVAIISMGIMNAVRAQRKNDSFLRWGTVVVTALTVSMCMSVLYHFPGNVLHQPAALAVGALAVFELFFAVVG